MRRLLTALVVLAATAAMPLLAMAGNQEVANEIAKSLRDSGQLQCYKIGVRYQDGTAWVRGYVSDQQQMAVALNVVAATSDVERVINELQIGVVKTQPAAEPQSIATAPSPPPNSSLRAATMKPDNTNNLRMAGLASESGDKPARQTTIRLAATPQKEPRPTLAKPAASPAAPPSRSPSGYFARTALQPVPTPLPVAQQRRPAARPTQAALPQRPLPVAYMQGEPMPQPPGAIPGEPMAQPMPAVPGGPMPVYTAGMGGGVAPMRYDQPHLPNNAWPSYAAYPNYAAVTYPRQYSPAAWPYIGPFYPYPQVPLGWRKVTLEWDDGWWMLDFCDSPRRCKF